jgi:hypothetical protein
MAFAKLYTWVVGGLFLVAVGVTLAIELAAKGITLEAGHKAIHVLIGLWALAIVVKNWELQYKVFSLFNGVLFSIVAAIGWIVPDFLGLDAFNRMDTILHSTVGVTGLASARLTKGL